MYIYIYMRVARCGAYVLHTKTSFFQKWIYAIMDRTPPVSYTHLTLPTNREV